VYVIVSLVADAKDAGDASFVGARRLLLPPELKKITPTTPATVAAALRIVVFQGKFVFFPFGALSEMAVYIIL